MRLFVEAVRVLVEAVRVIIEAVRKIFFFFFVYFFGGLECVGHSFAYVAHL